MARDGEGRYVDYEVPRQTSQTVLDVVTYIQRKLDPTLAYRYACRVGMCGSCAMTVNGVARWTCRTHVSAVAAKAIAFKLRRWPIFRSCAIWRPTCASSSISGRAPRAITRAHARGTTTSPRSSRHSKQAQALQAGIECIGCGVCYASCDVVGWRPDYLGPAALNRAWTLVNDVRDGARAERLRAVAGDAGCHSCHTHMSCTERCPKTHFADRVDRGAEAGYRARLR